MKKFILFGICMLTILFGVSFAFFTATGPVDQPLGKSVAQGLAFTALCAVVLAVYALAQRKKLGDVDNAEATQPQAVKSTPTEVDAPVKMGIYFFVVSIFISMALHPERELIDVASLAARVAGWVVIVLFILIDIVCPAITRKK